MKLRKMVLAVAGATVLLAGLVGMASAGRLSTSELRLRATWTRLSFSGGLGVVECEVAIEGSFHQRSITKTVGTLSGVITAGNINRCARGGVTVLRETLPWHVQYQSFAGTLPNISAIQAAIVGLSVIIREPTFGITCLIRSTTTEPALLTFNREASGVIASATAGGEIESSCGIAGSFSGTTSSLVAAAGGRVTITLI